MKNYRWLLIVVCTFLSTVIEILAFPFEYTLYSQKNGFGESFVYDIVQDRENYLWVGGIDGLYRYNGTAFQKFTTDNGLAENIVISLFVSTKGDIYAGHIQGGISIYKNQQFTHLPLPSSEMPFPISFLEYESRVFVLSRNHGVFLLDESEPKGFLTSYFKNKVCTGFTVFNDNLYISHNEGVSTIKVNELLNENARVREIPQLKNIPVAMITPRRSKDELWVVTNDKGLYTYKESSLERVMLAEMPLDIELFYEDNIGILWIGTKNQGIVGYTFQPAIDQYTKQYNIHTIAGFPTNQLSSIIQDHENNYWIGSFDRGLMYLKKNEVEFYSNSDFPFNKIYAAETWKEGKFLIGTNKGLYYLRYDPTTNEWLSDREEWMQDIVMTVSAILINDEGMYLGTMDQGIYWLDHNQLLTEVYGNSQLKGSTIKKIIEDRNKNIWVSASGSGIFKINVNKKELVNYSTSTGFIHNEIYDLFIDRKHRLWVSMHSNGLSVMDTTDHFIHLTKKGYVSARDINAVREDLKGNIWVATDGMGLFKYNQNYQLIRHYTVKNGLQSDYCAFLIPHQEYILVGYYGGMDRIYYTDNRIEPYFSNIGNDFTPSLNLVAHTTDEILVVTNNGFHIVKRHPKVSPRNRKLLLTEWKVNDRDILVSEDFHKGELVFPGKDVRLNFEYLTIGYGEPEKISYSYRLYDKQDEGVWSPPSYQRSVAFSNLNPGNYIFEVKSYFEDSPEDNSIISVQFKIPPPFYQNIWFLFLMVFSAVALTYVYHHHRTISIIRQKNEFEELVKVRTEEIHEQKEEIVRKNDELKSAQMVIVKKNNQLTQLNEKLEQLVEERTDKLKNTLKELEIFLYHASHDLKGPVARIKGLNLLARMENNHPNSYALELMDKEGVRMDYVLDKLAKIHAIISLEPQLSNIKLYTVIQNIIENYKDWKEYAEVNWNIEMDKSLTVMSDEATLIIILENLIENAMIFHANDPEKVKTVRINAAVHQNQVNICVFDNGVGIPKNIQSKIFDMYYRGSINSRGNGLGLFLVKKGIEKLNGTINLNTEPGKFTSFQIILPNHC